MKKYNLSPYYSILDVDKEPIPVDDTLRYQALQQVQAKELYLLKNHEGETNLLITPIIYSFLSAFREPITFKKTVEQFAEGAGCQPQEIVDKMWDFFLDMKGRGILVKSKTQQKTIIEKEEEIEEKQTVFQEEQIVGNYQIVELITQKSRVELYEARCLKSQKKVALKLMLLPTDLKKKKRKRRLQILRQEFKILKELQGHINICKYVDLVKKDGWHYGVMEYLDGYSMGRFLKYQQPTLAVKLQLIQDFISAMAHIHSKNILHGDLHSSNIIIEEGNLLKIIDFDLGNHRKLKKKEIRREGGVHHYIPPERISDSSFSVVRKAADFRSEVFQMGIIMYYLLYEVKPFTGFTWQDLIKDIKTKKPEFSTMTPKGEKIPQEVIDVLKKCLQKKRKRRYKSAVEIFKVESSRLKVQGSRLKVQSSRFNAQGCSHDGSNFEP